VDLYAIADQIPSMGGTKIGMLLREAARKAPCNTALVEVGCWLGAGTAQLALGIRERERQDVQLHCYDRWQANKSEVEKAAKRGWHLEVGKDTLPRMRQTLAQFNVPIRFHKGDLMEAVWEGGPISVYVDDASKTPTLFCHAIETFAPYWVPGETIVFLMDFEVWKKSGSADHMCQKRFIERYGRTFDRINSKYAVFRYKRKTDFTPWLRETRMVEGSLGWRITAPLRRIAAMARRWENTIRR
jgi:hypothetical protein